MIKGVENSPQEQHRQTVESSPELIQKEVETMARENLESLPEKTLRERALDLTLYWQALDNGDEGLAHTRQEIADERTRTYQAMKKSAKK